MVSVAGAQLEKGKILPRVQCAAHPDQTYALYLPSNYAVDRNWPLILSSDPAARGSAPLELQRAAAEKMGYVLAASNNSRNGPGQPRLEATEATLNDLKERVSIDDRRIYFAGFSGGARFSSQLARLCNCGAGVLLNGAGFSNGQSLATDNPFPVYSAIGIADFNYSEVLPLQDALDKAGYPRWLRVFDGAHEWAPGEVMVEALAWFRIEAMKANREPRDQIFLDVQFSEMRRRAEGFEQAGDLLAAWREYRQVAATFESLADVSPLRYKADALTKDKSVREALKRERNEFAEQAQLSGEITSRFDPSGEGSAERFQSSTEVRDLVARLRSKAQQGKRSDQFRVYQRSLGGVFIAAAEAGNSALDQKRYESAIRLFDFATEARPDSEWAWEQLAVANALGGKKKDALRSLERARDTAADKPGFARWLQSESSFESLRSSPEFQALGRAD